MDRWVSPDDKLLREWKDKDEAEGHLWYKVYEDLRAENLQQRRGEEGVGPIGKIGVQQRNSSRG